jgi:hypothetical protein
MQTNQPILKFCEKSDLNELYDVYLKNHPLSKYSLDNLIEYFDNVPNSILLGFVDNKIVAHLFCHPITVTDYDQCNEWGHFKYFDPNGDYLYIWGAGILKPYRTTYNFAWTVQNKQIEYNLNKYKNIQKSILHTINDPKLYRWHLLAGYKPVYVKNFVKIGDEIKNLIVLEFELRDHVEQNGYKELKKCYGNVNSGIVPQFLER